MLFERRKRFHLSQIQRVQVVFDTKEYRRSLTVGAGWVSGSAGARCLRALGRQDTDIQGRVHVDEETKKSLSVKASRSTSGTSELLKRTLADTVAKRFCGFSWACSLPYRLSFLSQPLLLISFLVFRISVKEAPNILTIRARDLFG
jgi:hypothetical protein